MHAVRAVFLVFFYIKKEGKEGRAMRKVEAF